jgi:hypothetical protein
MITSDLIYIDNIDDISTEYIENELQKREIFSPIRWSLVNANDENLTVSVAYEKN